MNYIISLSSIPSRFRNIYETISSIKSQSIKPSKIILNLPKFYNRFGKLDLKEIPVIDGLEVKICESDFGPATKIIPTLKSSNPDQKIIYCDDDIIYGKNWAESLLKINQHSPDCCVCGIGQSLKIIEIKHKYSGSGNPLTRLMSSMKYRREKKIIKNSFEKQNFSEIAAGYGGVLIKPKFFTADVFNIPPQLWAVDDIWISGNLALTNTKIIKDVRGKINITFSEVSNTDPLTRFVHNQSSRDLLNFEGIEFFKKNYGIWT